MSQWSDLPKELLQLIAERLDASFDILRLRSICSSWRSSVPPKPRRLPSRFPIFPNGGISGASDGFYLTKRSIFRLGLPESLRRADPNDWLIKVEENVHQRMQLLNPLSGCKLKPLAPMFPRILDLNRVRIYELGHEYVLQYVNFRSYVSVLPDADNLYMEKVAFSSDPGDHYVILTIHVSGKLAVFKAGDDNWSVIKDFPSPYDDVILFDGRFYAVDNTGRLVVVVVEPSPSVILIAGPVFGGDKKCLVESDGELLLVDIYMSLGLGEDSGSEDNEDSPYIMCERMVRFKVHQLDRNEKKWVEVRNLGNRMLFLGDNCTFSASASHFSRGKRNCIYFSDNCFYLSRDEDGPLKGRGIGVFDLDDGSCINLANCKSFSELFWPPPDWVTSMASEIGLEHMSI